MGNFSSRVAQPSAYEEIIRTLLSTAAPHYAQAAVALQTAGYPELAALCWLRMGSHALALHTSSSPSASIWPLLCAVQLGKSEEIRNAARQFAANHDELWIKRVCAEIAAAAG